MPLLLCILIGVALAPFLSLHAVTPFAGGLFLLLSSFEFNPRELTDELGLIGKLWLGAFLAPFVAGFSLPYLFPGLFSAPLGMSLRSTATVVGIALAVSAVPVVLKIIQELGWSGTVRAKRVMMTAVLCDLMAWFLFLPLLPSQGQSSWIVSHFTLMTFFVGLVLAYLWPSLTNPKSYLRHVNPKTFFLPAPRLKLSFY
jgi:Kef-type K+ transport system membrane component KefB